MIPKKKVTLQLQNVKSARSLYALFLSPQAVWIILCMLFCLLLSLLFFARGITLASPNVGQTLVRKVQQTSTVLVDPTSPPQAQGTSVNSQVIPASAAVPKALAVPIYPFPWNVPQQVGVLEMHQRFFFGGNPTLPEIALTFDDGPDPPYTNQVLAVLKQHNVKASFFDVGHHVAEHPELVQQELAQGNTVAIHSWAHVYLTSYSAAAIEKQIGDTSAILKKTTGVQPNFFRPPYGAYNAMVLAEANKLGLTTFMWNDVASDWLLPGTNVISSRVINAARYGSIVLLHDGDGDHYNAIASREQTVQALPTIITTLQARGYHFVTLDQLVADMHK